MTASAARARADRRVRELAERARRELREAALAGDRRARQALADLGELVSPRPWCDVERDEETG